MVVFLTVSPSGVVLSTSCLTHPPSGRAAASKAPVSSSRSRTCDQGRLGAPITSTASSAA